MPNPSWGLLTVGGAKTVVFEGSPAVLVSQASPGPAQPLLLNSTCPCRMSPEGAGRDRFQWLCFLKSSLLYLPSLSGYQRI